MLYSVFYYRTPKGLANGFYKKLNYGVSKIKYDRTNVNKA